MDPLAGRRERAGKWANVRAPVAAGASLWFTPHQSRPANPGAHSFAKGIFMRFPRTLIALAVAAAPLSAAVAQAPGDYEEGQVVATVNGAEITIEQVEEALRALGQQAAQIPREVAIPIVANQLATQELIVAEAQDQGLADDAEFQARLEQARTSILQDLWLQRRLEEAVTEERLQQAYDELTTDNPQFEQVRARHILVESQEEAAELIDQLDTGADFATLAEEHSIGPSAERGGDLGYFSRGDMVEPFGSTAFELDPGSYTQEPVETTFGWHVILVEDSRYEAPAFEEVRDQLIGQIENEVIGEVIEELRADAEIVVLGPDGEPVDPEAMLRQ
jgi:peptidyl-prolyl cis-trans isomerase C